MKVYHLPASSLQRFLFALQSAVVFVEANMLLLFLHSNQCRGKAGKKGGRNERGKKAENVLDIVWPFDSPRADKKGLTKDALSPEASGQLATDALAGITCKQVKGQLNSYSLAFLFLHSIPLNSKALHSKFLQ